MIGIYDINQNSNLNYKTRLDIYKNSGFKELALYIDDRYNRPDENYTDIIKYAREIGLEIRQAHIDYKISNLICDDSTNEYFEYVSLKLQEASQLNIPYIVAHASMSNTPPEINDTQLSKFANLLNSFEDKNITLCLENVRNNTNLDKILNLKLPNVKVCFDLGHANCYSDVQKLFNKYKSNIICSHLHNNYGTDTHNILNDGNIDYKYFLNLLNQIPNASNCLECFPKDRDLSEIEFSKFILDCNKTIS